MERDIFRPPYMREMLWEAGELKRLKRGAVIQVVERDLSIALGSFWTVLLLTYWIAVFSRCVVLMALA